jgi:hypothetical protein
MFNVAYVVIPILVWIIFAAIKKEVKNSEKDMNDKCFSVRQSKIVLWVGIVCALFCFSLIILMTIFPNDSASWWVYLIFISFSSLGISMVLYCIKWELKIEYDQLTYTTFLGKKKTFSMASIQKIKLKSGPQIIAYGEKGKLFSADFNCRGYNVLISRLRSEQIPFED